MLPVTTVHTTRRRWIACAAVGVCFVVAVIAPDPDRYQRSWLTLHDFLHVPGFTLITAALFFGFATGSRPRPPRPLHVLGVCVAALAVGIGIELAQAATVGSADPWDVVRDAGGIVSDVASAPRSRRLNLAQVKSVVLFAHNLEKPHELLVQELRLVP